MMKTLIDTRLQVVTKLNESIQNIATTKSIEKGIADYTAHHMKHNYPLLTVSWNNITTRRIYLRKYRQILFNIESIKSMITNGSTAAEQVAFVHVHRFRPDIWNPIYEAQEKKEMLTLLADCEDLNTEGLLKCENCGSMKTRYVTLQTRCADEPTTVFARCLQCSHRWNE